MSDQARLRFLPAGDSALVIELGNAIDPELNARVLALDHALLESPFRGYVEAIPSYRSLLVFFDPGAASYRDIEEHVRRLEHRAATSGAPPPRLHRVPVVYDGEDLDSVAALVGASREEVIRLHSERDYLVYMVGFTPGFAYMGETHEKFRIPRRSNPRTRVPAGSVAVAMGQTGIYPSATPGGWHLLGRAEHRDLFDVNRDPPSRFVPGDRVRFVPTSELPAFAPRAAGPPAASSAPSILVEDGGLLTTIQDLGRFRFQRYGVPTAGAMDRSALEAANRLVGNAPGAAGLECTVQGPTLLSLRTIVASVTGADLGAVVDRDDLGTWRVPPWSSFLLRAGNRLRFEGRRSGARAYVAFASGIDVPEVLGSRSTYLTAGFGGLAGRALRTADRLALLPGRGAAAPGARFPRAAEPESAAETTLRVVLGPQDDYFTAQSIETFTSASYTVAPSSDRMGYRLEGPALETTSGADFVSDGNMLGGIQVPLNGLPIVMLTDRGTMGGYPKIATVASADLKRLVQLLPGDRLRFEIVSRDEARDLQR